MVLKTILLATVLATAQASFFPHRRSAFDNWMGSGGLLGSSPMGPSAFFSSPMSLRNPMAGLDDFMKRQALPERTTKSFYDKDSDAIVVVIKASQAYGGKPFNIEVSDYHAPTLRIQENCRASGMWGHKCFSKSWRIPSSVNLDAVTAEWDQEAEQLTVRLPTIVAQQPSSAVQTTGEVAQQASQHAKQHERAQAEHAEQHARAVAKAEQEAREIAAKQRAQEKARKEAQEKALRGAREKAQREAREKAQREAREKAQREAREKAQREAQEKERRAREEAERLEAAKRQAQEQARQQTRSRQQSRRRTSKKKQKQKQATLPYCSAGMSIQAIYPPDGRFFDATLEALDYKSGRFALTWADGDTSFNVLPMRQRYVHGCAFAPSDPQEQQTETVEEEPRSSATRFIEPETQVTSAPVSQTASVDADDFFEIEEWTTDDEVTVKDDDASSGYYMAGEWHPY